MIEYMKLWAELRGNKRAVTAIEYGLIAALIAIAITAIVTTLGGTLSTTFGTVNSTLSGANAAK